MGVDPLRGEQGPRVVADLGASGATSAGPVPPVVSDGFRISQAMQRVRSRAARSLAVQCPRCPGARGALVLPEASSFGFSESLCEAAAASAVTGGLGGDGKSFPLCLPVASGASEGAPGLGGWRMTSELPNRYAERPLCLSTCDKTHETAPMECGHVCRRRCHAGPCEARLCEELVEVSCGYRPPGGRSCLQSSSGVSVAPPRGGASSSRWGGEQGRGSARQSAAGAHPLLKVKCSEAMRTGEEVKCRQIVRFSCARCPDGKNRAVLERECWQAEWSIPCWKVAKACADCGTRAAKGHEIRHPCDEPPRCVRCAEAARARRKSDFERAKGTRIVLHAGRFFRGKNCATRFIWEANGMQANIAGR